VTHGCDWMAYSPFHPLCPRSHMTSTTRLLALCSAAWLILLSGTAMAQDYDCLIEARQYIEIRSPVEAVIESVKVRRGEAISKGQVLVTLQSGPEKAAYELAKARAGMQSEIKAAEARVELASRKFNRADDLAKRNFVSNNARDEAEAELRLATEELHRARDNQQLSVHEAKRSGELLAMRTIRSPFNGVVIEVLLKPGEFGATSIRDPIMKLAETDPLHVEVILPVSRYGSIKQGQQAMVMPETPIGGKLKTTVSIVDRVIDAGSGTFGVRMILPNPKGEIPAGIRCKANFS
jgi:RND family efflux transporter MFP subunit